MGYTSISSLQYKLGLDSLPTVAATEVARIHHTETGGRPIADIRLFDTVTGPAALAINDEGIVFQSSVMSNTQAMCAFALSIFFSHSQITNRYPIYQPSEGNGTPIEAFQRLVVGTTSSTCCIVSSYRVQQLDLRVRLSAGVVSKIALTTNQDTQLHPALVVTSHFRANSHHFHRAPFERPTLQCRYYRRGLLA